MTRIIDADSHLFEQPGVWRDHMPRADRHLALDIEEDELGYSWLTHRGRRLLQCYISEPGKLWESYGLPHQRQRAGEPALVRYSEMPETYWNPSARTAALDGWGLDEMVLFPNWGLNFGWYLEGDAESERANVAAWNRWAVEVHQQGGGRLRPVGHLTLRGETGWALREVEQLARAGITQVFLGTGLSDGRRLSDPSHEPVWRRMSELGLAPTFHIGAFSERVIADGWQANDVIQYMTCLSLVMNGFEAQVALADLILNGVFDRNPDLRWVTTEYSVGWLPELKLRLDYGFDTHQQVTGVHNVELALRPSEYVERNLRFVSFPHEQPAALMDSVGEVLMFGSDFPHAEGVLNPLADYRRTVGDMGARSEAFFGGTFAAATGV